MVTVWGVLQFVLSKLTDAGETVPSVRAFDDNATLTVLPPPGLLSSTTVKVVDPPASVVTRPDVGVTVMPGPQVAPASRDPAEILDVREQGRLLRDALQVLTPAERQSIEAAFFSELTYREVAARLHQPLGTVKTRIRSGLGKLRHALTELVKDR